MKFIIILFIAIFAFSKNVLILNSYSVQFPWTKKEVEGILKNLKNKNLKIYIEFMDTKLFTPTPQYLNNFYEYLKLKYKYVPFDIVITTDDNALNFVLSHKELFKNSKIFFAGVNNLSIANKIDRTVFTGVFEKKEPIFNFNLLKKSVRNLKKIYVVADNSNSAKAVMKEYQNAFKNIKFNFIYINDENLTKVIKKVKDYKNSGMLLLTPFSFKLNNKKIHYKKAVKLISKHYKAPIVIHTDILASLADTNIIGGKVTDALSQGNSVSRQVLEYLNGKKIEDIPLIYEKANKLYLNVLNLKKLNIDLKKFDYKNAIYVNKPSSFFEVYKKYIVITVSIIFGLLVFIVVLLIKNYELIKYSKKIKVLNKNFEHELEDKLNEFSKYYYENLQLKLDAISDILKFMFRNIKILTFEIKKSKNCKENGVIIDNIISFCENNLKDKEFFIKEEIKKIVDILKKVKFYNDVEVEGENFLVNLDKILFIKIMIYLIKNNSKIDISDKKITINYFDEMPFDLEDISKSVKKMNIDMKIGENKIILDLN